MTLKEDIMRLSTKSGKVDYTKDLLKAYLKDKEVFGEDTADIYAAVYGTLMNEDVGELFEGIEDSFDNLLTEADDISKDIGQGALNAYNNARKTKAFNGEILKLLKSRSVGGDAAKSVRYDGSMLVPGTSPAIDKVSSVWLKSMKDQTFLGKLGNFFKGVKDNFATGKIFEALKNGLGWIISPKGLPIVAGTAAGVGVIAAIINALKKKGKAKEAEKLQVALDAAKKQGKK